MSIRELLGTITPPTDGAQTLSATFIDGREDLLLARHADGRVSLVGRGAAEPMATPVRLRRFQALWGQRVSLVADGSRIEETVDLITCSGHAPDVHDFLFLAEALLAVTPDDERVRGTFERLMELLRHRDLPAKGSLLGVWGELFVILQAVDPAALVDAWHTHPNDVLDFGSSDAGIEVKTTTGGERTHGFGLEQVDYPRGSVLVASVMTRSAGSGSTIYDLLEMLRSRLTNEQTARVHGIIRETLGERADEATDAKFDVALATEKLRFYDAIDIPRPRGPLDPGVSEVKFSATLPEEGADPSDNALWRLAASLNSRRSSA